MKFLLCTLLLFAFGSASGVEPPQGSHLKWRKVFISETTQKGTREVGLVKIFQDGQQIGVIDPRKLQLPGMDHDEEALEDLPAYVPPGVKGEPSILALSPDEKRLLFYVEVIPDRCSNYLLYFDVTSKNVVTLGYVGIGINDEFEKVVFGPNPDYAYVVSDISFAVINFKANTIKQIPPREEVLGPVSIPPDLVILSDGVWIKPNILSFNFHQEVCQNPDADINQVDRIFKPLPEKTCTYDFDAGQAEIKTCSGSVLTDRGVKPVQQTKEPKQPSLQVTTPKTNKSKKKQTPMKS